jgi:hypothetical protein
MESSRAVSHTQEEVDDHFYGPFELQATLIKRGIMDPLTKIFEPGRLLNTDESRVRSMQRLVVTVRIWCSFHIERRVLVGKVSAGKDHGVRFIWPFSS